MASTQSLDFVPRRENLRTIAMLGLSLDEVGEVILALTYQNYSAGPEVDQDGSIGEIWIFGAVIKNETIYIKLKLGSNNAKCLSFHIAKFPIKLPYGSGGTP